MLREEVLKEWNNCKDNLLRTISEIREYRPLLLKLKNAEWKTLAYRVFLFRTGEGRQYSLNDTISLWEWDNYYKISSSNTRDGLIALPEKEKIIGKWKVLTAKYLVVEEKDKNSLEEVILSNHLVKKIKESLADYQEELGNRKPISGDKRIGWKEENKELKSLIDKKEI